jgi:hypothetical protein
VRDSDRAHHGAGRPRDTAGRGWRVRHHRPPGEENLRRRVRPGSGVPRHHQGPRFHGEGQRSDHLYGRGPPACWYEPYWKAKDFKKFNEAQWSIYESVGGAPEGIADDKARYKQGHPYKDFNVDKNDEGMWWVAVKNPEMKDDPAARTCTRKPFWVDNGDNPDVPQAIDTETLAGLAHQRTVVPPTKVSLAPNGKSTVNAPTWVWLDKGTFKPVSVTASLPGTGLWATTTAKPVSLHLDPGTEDAESLPASGECVINDDGSIGEPYARGKAELTPPCGVRYLRSSGDGTYGLKATLTWEISWEGAGGTGGDLPSGTFATTTEVPVQEIQSVNR